VDKMEKDYLDLSGGEKSAISLAYRLGLSKIINERYQDEWISNLPRSIENIVTLIEAKRKGNSIFHAFQQAKDYAKAKHAINRFREKLYKHEERILGKIIE